MGIDRAPSICWRIASAGPRVGFFPCQTERRRRSFLGKFSSGVDEASTTGLFSFHSLEYYNPIALACLIQHAVQVARPVL